MPDLLYKKDVYLKEVDSTVIKSNKNEASFSRTIFFPEGGGQSGDRGKLICGGKEINVLDTIDREGEVIHILDCELNVGDSVHMVLDWEHRFDNMQRHSGEHIVSGAFYDLYGGINRGFHMGEEYMTIDISLEDEKKVDKLTWDMCLNAEKYANDVIHMNLPILRSHFDNKEEASKYPMRKKLAIENDITLVGIGSWDNAWGTVACCGTHPNFTGEVGLIKFYKMEVNKGMYRIYLEAGKRAFNNYVKQYETLTELSKKFSSSVEDILEKYEAILAKQQEKSDELFRLKKDIVSREVKEILESSINIKEYSNLNLDDLNNIGKELSLSVKGLIKLVHIPTSTVILVSDGSIDCGKMVKDRNVKGGGSKTMARAMFNTFEEMRNFLV